MKEKLRLIYNSKAKYYLQVLNEFDNDNLSYVLLNYLIPDDNPGDLDVLISLNDFNLIEKILKKNKFKFYRYIDTNQIIWNKFVSNIGFIQFHLYVGLNFHNKQFYNNTDIGIYKDDLNFSFMVFLLESFYRNKLKKQIFNKYVDKISIKNFENYLKFNFKNTMIIVDHTIELYKDGKNTNTFKNFLIKLHTNKFGLVSFYFNKIFSKIKRLGNNQDVFLLIVGVDGSGKTLLTNNMFRVLSKGGIFPVKLYFGLKSSFIYKVFNKKKDKNSKTFRNNDLKLRTNFFVRFLKIFLYWIEYNFRILYNIKMKPNSSKTIYLVDRSYLDLIFYNSDVISKNLFLNHSIKPTHLVYITGESSIIYNRKKEGSKINHEKKVNFFDEL